MLTSTVQLTTLARTRSSAPGWVSLLCAVPGLGPCVPQGWLLGFVVCTSGWVCPAGCVNWLAGALRAVTLTWTVRPTIPAKTPSSAHGCVPLLGRVRGWVCQSWVPGLASRPSTLPSLQIQSKSRCTESGSYFYPTPFLPRPPLYFSPPQIQSGWTEGDYDVVVATIAFGESCTTAKQLQAGSRSKQAAASSSSGGGGGFGGGVVVATIAFCESCTAAQQQAIDGG